MEKTILVVDDNHTMLEGIKEILESMGHCVVTKDNAVAALDVLLSFVPDILFVDLMMPGFNGDKLSKIVRKMPHLTACRIVILTSCDQPEYDYQQLGALGCITKGPLAEMAGDLSGVMRALDKESRSPVHHFIKNDQPDNHCRFKDDQHPALENLPEQRTDELRRINEQLLIEISERKHVDESWKESEFIWKNIYNAIPDAVCLLDMEGRVLHCNEAMEKVFKLSQKAIVGHSLWNVFNHTNDCEIRALFFQVQKEKQRQQVSMKIRKRYANILMTPLFDERYFFTGAVFILHYQRNSGRFVHKSHPVENVNFIPLS